MNNYCYLIIITYINIENR